MVDYTGTTTSAASVYLKNGPTTALLMAISWQHVPAPSSQDSRLQKEGIFGVNETITSPGPFAKRPQQQEQHIAMLHYQKEKTKWRGTFRTSKFLEGKETGNTANNESQEEIIPGSEII
eukprot:8271329-Ditylum_brightwellii.AAC.1